MRIAVAGGTGVVGPRTVEALRRANHETIVMVHSRGVDVLTGKGLDDALVGADVVIDVTNIVGCNVEETRIFSKPPRGTCSRPKSGPECATTCSCLSLE